MNMTTPELDSFNISEWSTHIIHNNDKNYSIVITKDENFLEELEDFGFTAFDVYKGMKAYRIPKSTFFLDFGLVRVK